MNNQFLQHLKSITPQGKAEEKKIFIPASEFKDKKADPIEIEADEEQLDEAVSTNDPNRGRMGRAKPKLPPGLDPYDMYSKGEIRPYGGKLQKRIASMSPEDRKRYYREIGIRSRAASRGGKTQRLFPMTEGVKRMRRLRTARFGQQGVKKELDAAYDKELSKLSASRLRRGGATKQTVRGFFTDKPTTKAADKAYSKFSKGAMEKASAKGKKIFESKTPKPLKKLKRKLVKTKNRLRNLGKAAFDIMGKPQDNIDYMITGRKF